MLGTNLLQITEGSTGVKHAQGWDDMRTQRENESSEVIPMRKYNGGNCKTQHSTSSSISAVGDSP